MSTKPSSDYKAAKHKVTIHWEKQPDGEEAYSWSFDNGLVIHNASHATVAHQGMTDPESAFVASVAACHMLSFMAMAVKKGMLVSRYHDVAVGVLEMNSDNRIAITRILLQPHIRFHGDNQPDEDQLAELHEATSRHCFIANSIKTTIQVAPVIESETPA